MIRPLRELRRGIKSMSRSGLNDPIRIYSNDEFGELAGAFNDMAARLTEEERMRSDFISMLSHEIRTPLTSIRESVNLIAEEVMGDINEKQRRFLLIASHELERITTLLNHLMQISRLEAGAVEIHQRDRSIFANSFKARFHDWFPPRRRRISRSVRKSPPGISNFTVIPTIAAGFAQSARKCYKVLAAGERNSGFGKTGRLGESLEPGILGQRLRPGDPRRRAHPCLS